MDTVIFIAEGTRRQMNLHSSAGPRTRLNVASILGEYITQAGKIPILAPRLVFPTASIWPIKIARRISREAGVRNIAVKRKAELFIALFLGRKENTPFRHYVGNKRYGYGCVHLIN